MNTKYMAAYLRVSTGSQDTNAQQNVLCGWLQAQSVNLDDVVRYEDVGYSGSLPAIKRPAFAKLVDDINAGKVTKVILFEASRASRDFIDYLNFLNLCKGADTLVELVGKGVVNFETSTDLFMASVHAYTSAIERERTIERVKAGMAAAKQRGVKLGANKGDKRRLGYRKEYPQALIDELRFLRGKGMTAKEISAVIDTKYSSKPLSIPQVTKLLRKFCISKAA